MKLHDALRELWEKHGNIIVQKKNLVYLLSDMGAFEEFPGMREVMKVLVSGGFAKRKACWPWAFAARRSCGNCWHPGRPAGYCPVCVLTGIGSWAVSACAAAIRRWTTI